MIVRVTFCTYFLGNQSVAKSVLCLDPFGTCILTWGPGLRESCSWRRRRGRSSRCFLRTWSSPRWCPRAASNRIFTKRVWNWADVGIEGDYRTYLLDQWSICRLVVAAPTLTAACCPPSSSSTNWKNNLVLNCKYSFQKLLHWTSMKLSSEAQSLIASSIPSTPALGCTFTYDSISWVVQILTRTFRSTLRNLPGKSDCVCDRQGKKVEKELARIAAKTLIFDDIFCAQVIFYNQHLQPPRPKKKDTS